MTEGERLELCQYAQDMNLAERLEMWERAAILERHIHMMEHGEPRPLSDLSKLFEKYLLARFAGARWYHGGAPGRTAGDRLFPASVTGADPRSNGDMVPDRARFVHVTVNLAHAADFAASFPGGGVCYEVHPIGPVTVLPVQLRLMELMALDVGTQFDPLSVGPSFCCEAATVLRVCHTKP